MEFAAAHSGIFKKGEEDIGSGEISPSMASRGKSPIVYLGGGKVLQKLKHNVKLVSYS